MILNFVIFFLTLGEWLMYCQYETHLVNRKKLNELLTWFKNKINTDYEVIQESHHDFYVIFRDLNEKNITLVQNKIKGSCLLPS
jgi:hypothetical protein